MASSENPAAAAVRGDRVVISLQNAALGGAVAYQAPNMAWQITATDSAVGCAETS